MNTSVMMRYMLEMLVLILLLHVCLTKCTEQNGNNLVDPEKGLLFDNFLGYILELSLNGLSDVDQKTTLVSSKMDCVFACIGVAWCRSVNFKIPSQKKGQHACELLSLDIHTHKREYLKQNETFTHLSIKDPCKEHPCLNDGKCIRRNDNRHDFRCQCSKGFTEERCQKDINECAGAHGCHSNAHCVNTPGSYKCICNISYGGDGRSCVGTAAISVSVSKNCSSSRTHQSTIPHSGEVMSPGYPGTYSNDLNCYWNITSNTKIGLYFKTFLTEAVHDNVTIRDGNTYSSPVLGKYSGNVKPSTYITSSTNSLYMTFKTNHNVPNKGFAVKYEALVQGYLRLNGTSSTIGRVEIFFKDQWGTICDNNWDINDAHVVCKQLGFPGAKTAFSNAAHGRGSGPIWVDNLSCTDSESNIKDCASATWGTHNCDHSEDASVECNKRVRLVNGGAANKGRVEVYHWGQWGTVCDDAWGIADGNVVCRELGYSNASSTPGKAKYGQGTGPIWISDAACLGTEDSLLTCGYRGWISGSPGCSHREDACVVCN